MKRTSFKSLVLAKVITGISEIRENANGYYFITMLSGAKSNNVYLSKNAKTMCDTLGLVAGDKLSADLKKSMEIVETTNEAKETRFKLSFGGVSDFDSLTQLRAELGIEDTIEDFDVKAFSAEFKAKEAVVV